MGEKTMSVVPKSTNRLDVMPIDLTVLDTGYGLVKFRAIQHRVHGVKMNIKTEVSGSGGGWWFGGTGMSGMSVSSQSQKVREFWLAPIGGGKESYFEMVDSDFHVSDGQSVIGMYAQVENNPPALFAMINVNSGCALKMHDADSDAFHDHCATQLLGKNRSLNGIVIFMALGLAGWVWFAHGWQVGLPAVVATILGVGWLLQKVPVLKSGSDHYGKKVVATKKIKERVYLCLKWIDARVGPQWV
jgi:hypothetical protein